MTDWADDLTCAAELRETVEQNPGTIASALDELLELAHNEEWSVQQAAVNGIGVGLLNCPEAGVSEVDTLIRLALDETVPSPDRWREGLVSLTAAAPETVRDGIFAGFEAVSSDQRDDAGEGCLARILERLAVDNLTVLAESPNNLRDVYRTSGVRARQHLLGVFLTLVDSQQEAIRPLVPDLLAEFESGNGTTRRSAADLLCALATPTAEGRDVVKNMLRWLATHPQKPPEQYSWLGPAEPVMHPSLTDSPPAGILGVTQVLARIAEEASGAVAPHCTDIIVSLRKWESTTDDQWPRSHIARAVAAVARQQPDTLVPVADTVPSLLTDDSEFVRYWATQTLLALYPHRPDIVTPKLVADLLTDDNPDIRSLGADLAVSCVENGSFPTDEFVAHLQTVISETTDFESQQALGVFPTVAQQEPTAVQPALSTLETYLSEPVTASDAAATFEGIALEIPEALEDVIPTLVDCLFADSITVRDAVAEPLVAIGSNRPSLLDDQLDVLSTVVEQPHAGIDAISTVLATVGDRPLRPDCTVFEYVRAQSTADSPEVREAATQLLGAFIEATNNTEEAVAALKERLEDTDERVQEAAIAALATYVAETAASSLVQSIYETGTERWRKASAELFARATLVDGEWPSSALQHWLADRLHEAAGETRRLFIEAAGHICGQTAAEDELVTAVLHCLEDTEVSDTAFSVVQRIVSHGESTVPATVLAPPVERTVLDPDREVPVASIDLVAHLTDDLAAPQRVADRLLHRLDTGESDAGRHAAALAALCTTGVTLPPAVIVGALRDYALTESITTRDWTCQNFGRVLREVDGGPELRESFLPLLTDDSSERRAAGYSALASVAAEWPAGVRPLAQTLQAGIDDEDTRVSDSALSALVAVGRLSPAVLDPIKERVTAGCLSCQQVECRRRWYEALSLLAADGVRFRVTVARILRAGILDNDTAVEEFALTATAELADTRLISLLKRQDRSVPDWGNPPSHYQTRSAVESEPPFANLLRSNEMTVTAGDVLEQLEERSPPFK